METTLETIAIIDTETSGLDPANDHVIEIGCVLWSIRWACVIATWSDLVQQSSNEAESVNNIPTGALDLGLVFHAAISRLRAFTARADVIVAHRAEFDSGFLPDIGKPWVCSKFDIEWPASKPGEGLAYVALAHGVPVTETHRALTDCLLLARVFEAAHRHHGADIRALLARAMRPRGLFQALTSYEEREMTKAAGFQWDPATKMWTRRIALDDVGALPFKVRRLDAEAVPPMERTGT